MQINSSNIRNTIFCQLASLGTGVLRTRQNLAHCPKATNLMSVANLMFTYPFANVFIRRYEVIIERSLCQISFHNSSLAGCDKTLPDVIKRCVWDNWEIFTRKKITHEGESVVSRKVRAPKTSWFCFFFSVCEVISTVAQKRRKCIQIYVIFFRKLKSNLKTFHSNRIIEMLRISSHFRNFHNRSSDKLWVGQFQT